jgi:conjugal transfer pilus assembly protein TrbC
MLRFLRKHGMGTGLFVTYTALSFLCHAPFSEAGQFDLEDVGDYLENAGRLSRKIGVPENIHGARGREEAQKTLDRFQSDEFCKKHEAEIERLKTTVFKETLNAYYGDAKGGGKGKSGILPVNERIYLFVSSSMPILTLKNYARDLDRLGDPNVFMVMRGFVGGMKHVKPTLDFVQKIIAEDANCKGHNTGCNAYRVNIKIDPLLFRRYGITRVPSTVYVPDLRITDPGLSEGVEGNVKTTGNHYTLLGDASLEYILETFRKESGRRSIEPVLDSLKGGIYRQEEKR